MSIRLALLAFLSIPQLSFAQITNNELRSCTVTELNGRESLYTLEHQFVESKYYGEGSSFYVKGNRFNGNAVPYCIFVFHKPTNLQGDLVYKGAMSYKGRGKDYSVKCDLILDRNGVGTYTVSKGNEKVVTKVECRPWL